jgi:hypothetical protein
MQVSLMRSYKSDPILFADPISTRVELDKVASDWLKENGPKAFHEKYGTHYVAGYTVGAPRLLVPPPQCSRHLHLHDMRVKARVFECRRYFPRNRSRTCQSIVNEVAIAMHASTWGRSTRLYAREQHFNPQQLRIAFPSECLRRQRCLFRHFWRA